MTEDYDATNPLHREICHGIEVGDGISQMVKISEALRAIKACGFELEFHEDLAQRPDEVPWWYPLGIPSFLLLLCAHGYGLRTNVTCYSR